MIQANTGGREGYVVTMYNLDGNHPVWGTNIQMSPKQMKISEQSQSSIQLRGYGVDSNGGSFSDYGITLKVKSGKVENVTLHMFDRDIDILYFKGEVDKIAVSPNADNQKLQGLPSDYNDIISICRTVNKCKSLSELYELYSQGNNFDHPMIFLSFGLTFLINSDSKAAKHALLRGAEYGTVFPCKYYDSFWIDSIGQCLSILMTQFPLGDISAITKATSLGHIYLSRRIEIDNQNAHNAYMNRALLLMNHGMSGLLQRIIMNNLGMGNLIEPLFISDLYFAYHSQSSPYKDALNNAKTVHSSLGDISIGGRDADEYSLYEISELGEKRNFKLFKNLEEKYYTGLLNLDHEELISCVK